MFSTLHLIIHVAWGECRKAHNFKLPCMFKSLDTLTGGQIRLVRSLALSLGATLLYILADAAKSLPDATKTADAHYGSHIR
jgi:hypothetical protein